MARTYPHVQKFVDACTCYAKQVEAEQGIPFLVIMAQAALESGYGKNAPGYNYFGVKATNWDGEKQLITTLEYFPSRYTEYEICKKFPEVIRMEKTSSGKWKCTVKDWFRKYPSPLQSFQDYASVLKQPIYAAAFSADSPENFIRKVAEGGYATAPKYADTVIRVMNLLKRHLQEDQL